MSQKEFVIRWNNLYRYDYWWRQKYGVPFNSEMHREANQIDILFEYIENNLSNEALAKYKDDGAKQKRLKETGQWMKESESKKEAIVEAFDKLDLKDF